MAEYIDDDLHDDLTLPGFAARAAADSRVEMTQLVLPGQANSGGNAFGGQVMAWIDIAAAVAAGRHAGGKAVTASVDQVHFLRPIKQGHIVVIQAEVSYVGNSSIEVEVLVHGEPWGGERYFATTAFTTFVALDEDGRPRPVRKLLLHSEDERRRFRDGQARMEQRKAVREAQVAWLERRQGRPNGT